MEIYQLSPAGRRLSLLLLVTALIIWALALWTFRSTLGTVPNNPNAGFFEALQQNFQQGMGVNQLVPALLMLALIVAAPLACWNILEEYVARYTTADDGLHYDSIGVHLVLPWASLVAITRKPDESVKLRGDRDYSAQIRNPLVRLLHIQANGRRGLLIPLYVTGREALLETLTTRATHLKPSDNREEQETSNDAEPRGVDSRI